MEGSAVLLLLLLYLGDGGVGCAADRAARCGRDGAQLLEQGRALGGGRRRLAVAHGGGGLCEARLTRVSSRPVPALLCAVPCLGLERPVRRTRERTRSFLRSWSRLHQADSVDVGRAQCHVCIGVRVRVGVGLGVGLGVGGGGARAVPRLHGRLGLCLLESKARVVIVVLVHLAGGRTSLPTALLATHYSLLTTCYSLRANAPCRSLPGWPASPRS